MSKGDPRGGEQRFAAPERAAAVPSSHIFAILLGMMAIGGFASYTIRKSYQTSLDLWKSELSASVSYQTWTLRNSLQQSQDDAQVLADLAATKELLLQQGNPALEAATRKQISSLFEEYRKVYEYGALCLFDEPGRIQLQATNSAQWGSMVESPKFKELFQSVIRNRHFAIELRQGLGQELTLLFMMPVFSGNTTDPSDRAQHSLIGVVVIIDPLARDLLPLLTAKSAGTRTGETVLLRLDAGDPRYASGPTRTSLISDTLRPAASTAVESRAVFGQFVDYRGVSVLAAMEKIQSINCAVVRKIDNEEALGDFRRVARIETVTAVSIFLAYFGLVLMHNRRTVARETREGLKRQQLANQILETTVATRTSELAEMNRQLHQELGERLRAEEEVRRFNVELDQRVNERTAELETANKELEAFSYSVSHDLRAPLRRMGGFSTILLEEHGPQLPEEALKWLDVVNKNAVQMGEIIDCLLAFSRLGRQPLRKQDVDPGNIVLAAWQDLSTEREGRHVEFTLGELPPCAADPLLLKQVVTNLLSNALKYSRTREPARIDVGYLDPAVYFIRDNGVGFDMRYGDKLFGAFKRLHRAEDYEGIGIGLAIVEQIVRRHGGRVWADAVVNQGATFYFTLA